jgi:vacuolar-type H+-ATPase subunit I/STV1
MSSGRSGPPAVRKHLMTPGRPRPQRPDSMSVTSVQRWVMSVLVTTTILHLSAGLVVAAYFSRRPDSRIGLLVISGLFGLLAFEAALLIHQHRPVSFWLLPGLLPALVGAYLLFG